jgi:hypothetical protein
VIEGSVAVERGFGLGKDIFALNELSDDSVISIKDVGSITKSDQDLAAIGVFSVVGEGEGAATDVA